MPVIDTVLGIRLVWLLGITNIITLLLVLLSCRCLGGAKVVERLWRHSWYQRFYRLHCYWWWLFLLSVLLHTTLAFLVFGLPP
ncbi:MAG: hypothetical protein QXH27_02940 [Candidatus Micrarchaeia archaeon]